MENHSRSNGNWAYGTLVSCFALAQRWWITKHASRKQNWDWTAEGMPNSQWIFVLLSAERYSAARHRPGVKRCDDIWVRPIGEQLVLSGKKWPDAKRNTEVFKYLKSPLDTINDLFFQVGTFSFLEPIVLLFTEALFCRKKRLKSRNKEIKSQNN